MRKQIPIKEICGNIHVAKNIFLRRLFLYKKNTADKWKQGKIIMQMHELNPTCIS